MGAYVIVPTTETVTARKDRCTPTGLEKSGTAFIASVTKGGAGKRTKGGEEKHEEHL